MMMMMRVAVAAIDPAFVLPYAACVDMTEKCTG
jgi:hypothetical protein